ncbi:MAG: hypothetical protein A3J79_12715 [Elusimicrobia bacterium RIFOXYB2_FULL_62_6]|nr:MAG: hypothetical protein A3J79_12715 [Elusimicrobia bacterium RIFOXYB2_FULL_62_6]
MKGFNLWNKIRIRLDRLHWFLNGFIITCFIASFVAAYWHSQDRLSVRPKVKITKKAVSREAETKKLREANTNTQLRGGATKYYKMEEEMNLPKIPDLPDEYDGN